MKFIFKHFALSALLFFVADGSDGDGIGAVSADDLYTPTRISYDELVSIGRGDGEKTFDMNEKFWKTLQNVGMVSITDIPNFNKGSMFETMVDCIHNRKEITVPEFTMDGGTKRLTVATKTDAGNSADLFMAFKDQDGKSINACMDFQKESKGFRDSIQMVTDAFASLLGLYSSNPVLINDEGEDLNIQDVIMQGEHLEHFHSYYTNDDPSSSNTIDWHTDQGLMLVFTPGQQDGKATSGFFIQLKDGSSVEVDFDETIDDVVIMLGDGFDQYFNSKANMDLRVVPHALTLPATNESSGLPRIWYGRMVLPPNNAIVPASFELMKIYDNAIAYTFEDMKKGMIAGDGTAINLGCSNPNQVARDLQTTRLLEPVHLSKQPDKWLAGGELAPFMNISDGIICERETEIFCWQRCMDFNNTDYKESCESEEGCNEFYNGNPNDITREKCEAVGLEAMCMDDENHRWIPGYHNHDYYLQCGNPDTVILATYPPTREPTLPPPPTPAKECPEWDELKPCVALPESKEVPDRYKDLVVMDRSTMYEPLRDLTEFPVGSDIELHLQMVYYIGPSWSAPITTFNSMGPAPIIRVKAGQNLPLTYHNDLENPLGNNVPNSYRLPNTTNLHIHGGHISGMPPGDDVTLTIDPGQKHKYFYEFNRNHMPGTHWYHPHFHGSVSLQTGSGVASMFIVEDPPGYLPKQIEDLPEIHMMIQQLDFELLTGTMFNNNTSSKASSPAGVPIGSAGALYWGDSGQNVKHTKAVSTNTDTFLINMQYIPVITLESGKWYRMRMVMSTVNEGLTFTVPKGCDLELLAKDGIYLQDAPRTVDAVYLKPGNRADIAIRCDLEVGAYSVDIISTGQTGPERENAADHPPLCPDRFMQTSSECNDAPRFAVISVVDSGKPKEADLKPFGAGLSRPCYLADTTNAELASEVYPLKYGKKPSGYTEIVPEGQPGAGTPYTVLAANDKDFNIAVPNNVYQMGTVNEIILTNFGEHPHHQHVMPFQVMNIEGRVGKVNGLDPDNWFRDGDWMDSLQYVTTDYRPTPDADLTPATATIRFATNYYNGTAIYHCHILIHEDRGMMGWFRFEGREGAVWPGAKRVDPTCRVERAFLSPYKEPSPPTPAPSKKPLYTRKPTQQPIYTRKPTTGPTLPALETASPTRKRAKKSKKYKKGGARQ